MEDVEQQVLSTGIAKEINEKLREQIPQLIGRNWPDISDILGEEEEVKLSFSVVITNRGSSPGTQADKDHRIKTTLSFSRRVSDTTEAALEDPAQPELFDTEEVGNEQEVRVPGASVQPLESAQPKTSYDGTKKPEPRNLGSTPLGQALAEAAVGKDVPIVPIEISGDYTPERARNQFRRAAKKTGWPEACIDTLDEALLACGDDMEAVLRILSAHTLTPAPKAA